MRLLAVTVVVAVDDDANDQSVARSILGTLEEEREIQLPRSVRSIDGVTWAPALVNVD